VGDTLYGARVYVKLGRRLAHAHAADAGRSMVLAPLLYYRCFLCFSAHTRSESEEVPGFAVFP
jgi:hypothetical protein